jgi:hypothetical protein
MHPAHDPRLDHGAAVARSQEPRCGEARGSPTPEPAARLPTPRERPPAFSAAWSACARKGFALGPRV